MYEVYPCMVNIPGKDKCLHSGKNCQHCYEDYDKVVEKKEELEEPPEDDYHNLRML